jgi:hypothetical protein
MWFTLVAFLFFAVKAVLLYRNLPSSNTLPPSCTHPGSSTSSSASSASVDTSSSAAKQSPSSTSALAELSPDAKVRQVTESLQREVRDLVQLMTSQTEISKAQVCCQRCEHQPYLHALALYLWHNDNLLLLQLVLHRFPLTHSLMHTHPHPQYTPHSLGLGQ